jgi:hypothetical protein
MKRFFVMTMLAGLAVNGAAPAAERVWNKDEAKAGDYALPDPLQPSGLAAAVTDKEGWLREGRSRTLALFEQHVYGKTPEGPWKLEFETLSERRDALDGLATRRIVLVKLKDLPAWPGMEVMVYIPNQRLRGPVPVLAGLSFYGNHSASTEPDVPLSTRWMRNNKDHGTVDHRATEASRGSSESRWPFRAAIERGYAAATAYYGDLEPDHAEGWRDGVRGAMRERDGENGPMREGEWGAIGAWAWGLSRMLDLLETMPEIDAAQCGVHGHSRLGKTALWAGAQDERFAFVISNNSGEGGAALKYRDFGETPAIINKSFPHWFTETYNRYNADPKTCPVDQHQLIALVAPRLAYVASATEDLWADPKGEFLSALHAQPVYSLFGLTGVGVEDQPPPEHPAGGHVGYHLRIGPHNITEYDWLRFMDFFDRHRGAGQSR